MIFSEADSYQKHLFEKISDVQELLSPFTNLEPNLFFGSFKGFRQRVEFRIWHDKTSCHYAMFDPATKQALQVEQFPIAAPAIQVAMPCLLHQINASKELKHRIFQVEFLSTLTGELLITLIYHRPLDDAWLTEARNLEKRLNACVIGRSHKQKLILSKDYVLERFVLTDGPYLYQQPEGCFSQPNAFMNQQMLNWVQQIGSDPKADLLELYCGNGNFSIALAKHFRNILATELSKKSIKAAQCNAQLNQIKNIQFVRMSAEEVTQALRNQRAFRRLPPHEASRYQFSTVLVDPPRAGLTSEACSLIAQYPRILYFSCNPLSLSENLRLLHSSHCVKHFALFDQFPHTHHIECGLLLEKG